MRGNVRGTFFGRHTSLKAANVFMFFVTDDAFHLGRVSDRFDREYMQSKAGTSMLFVGLGGLLVRELVIKPSIKRREILEEKYGKLKPGSPDFLKLDDRNYTIKSSDIAEGTFTSAKAGTQRQQRAGILQLQMTDGRSLKFELASPLDPSKVEKLIRIVAPQIKGELK